MESSAVSQTEFPVFRRVTSIVAVVTLVQGIAWIIFSLIGVLATWQILKFSASDSDVSSTLLFPKNVKDCYFPENTYDFWCCQDLVMPGGGFRGTVVVYLFMSIVWSSTSAVLLYRLWTWSKDVCSITKLWTITTLTVCFLDLVVTILFGVDYHILNHHVKYSNDFSNCLGVMGAPAFMMSLAARGYILWLLNLVAASWLLMASTKIRVNKRSSLSSVSEDVPNEALCSEPVFVPQKEIGPKTPPRNIDPNTTENTLIHSHTRRKSQETKFRTQRFSGGNARTLEVDETDSKPTLEDPESNYVDISNENSSSLQKDVNVFFLKPAIIFPKRPWIDVNPDNMSPPIRNPLALGESPVKLQTSFHHLSPVSFQNQPRSVSPVPDYDVSGGTAFDSAFTEFPSEFSRPDVTPPSTLIVEHWRKQILQENEQWPQTAEEEEDHSSSEVPKRFHNNHKYRRVLPTIPTSRR